MTQAVIQGCPVFVLGRWLEGQRPPYATDDRVAVAVLSDALFAVVHRQEGRFVGRLHSARWLACHVTIAASAADTPLPAERAAKLAALLPPLPILENDQPQGDNHG